MSLTELPKLDDEALDALFYKAATEHSFQDRPVPEELLRKAIEMTYLAPTAFNCAPMRVVFITSEEGRKKLQDVLMEGNKKQTSEAPVTAIICYDTEWQKQLPKLMPFVPNVESWFEPGSDANTIAMTRNANLQAGYLIIALRALGLGVGPMSGFVNAKCDEVFLSGTTYKSNFLLNIGYPNPEARFPRAPRFEFDETAKFA